MLQEYSGDRNGNCGDPAGMEFVFAETQRGSFRNLADDKNSRASVRIPYQVDCRKMSYVTTKYVADSWNSVTVLLQKRCYDAGQLQYMLPVKF